MCNYCYPESIIYSNDNNNIVYPTDTNHYCFDGNHISVNGYDNIGYKLGRGRRSYGFIEIRDSCYYTRKFFKSKSNSKCEFTKTIYPIRRYGNCFISINNNDTRKTISLELYHYLMFQDCIGCQLGDYSQIETSNGINLHLNYFQVLTILLIAFIIL